jgi:hypothetical protein
VLTVTSSGAVIVGSSSSVTVTFCVQLAVFPDVSVTVQVTVVSPLLNWLGALLLTLEPVQLSEPVALPRLTLVA